MRVSELAMMGWLRFQTMVEVPPQLRCCGSVMVLTTLLVLIPDHTKVYC